MEFKSDNKRILNILLVVSSQIFCTTFFLLFRKFKMLNIYTVQFLSDASI